MPSVQPNSNARSLITGTGQDIMPESPIHGQGASARRAITNVCSIRKKGATPG
jgi:hypothetical protein